MCATRGRWAARARAIIDGCETCQPASRDPGFDAAVAFGHLPDPELVSSVEGKKIGLRLAQLLEVHVSQHQVCTSYSVDECGPTGQVGNVGQDSIPIGVTLSGSAPFCPKARERCNIFEPKELGLVKIRDKVAAVGKVGRVRVTSRAEQRNVLNVQLCVRSSNPALYPETNQQVLAAGSIGDGRTSCEILWVDDTVKYAVDRVHRTRIQAVPSAHYAGLGNLGQGVILASSNIKHLQVVAVHIGGPDHLQRPVFFYVKNRSKWSVSAHVDASNHRGDDGRLQRRPPRTVARSAKVHEQEKEGGGDERNVCHRLAVVGAVEDQILGGAALLLIGGSLAAWVCTTRNIASAASIPVWDCGAPRDTSTFQSVGSGACMVRNASVRKGKHAGSAGCAARRQRSNVATCAVTDVLSASRGSHKPHTAVVVGDGDPGRAIFVAAGRLGLTALRFGAHAAGADGFCCTLDEAVRVSVDTVASDRVAVHLGFAALRRIAHAAVRSAVCCGEPSQLDVSVRRTVERVSCVAVAVDVIALLPDFAALVFGAAVGCASGQSRVCNEHAARDGGARDRVAVELLARLFNLDGDLRLGADASLEIITYPTHVELRDDRTRLAHRVEAIHWIHEGH